MHEQRFLRSVDCPMFTGKSRVLPNLLNRYCLSQNYLADEHDYIVSSGRVEKKDPQRRLFRV